MIMFYIHFKITIVLFVLNLNLILLVSLTKLRTVIFNPKVKDYFTSLIDFFF